MTKPESYFILIDKTVGPTSFATIRTFSKIAGTKKIGHHGTLDPFAEGLLLAGIGEATKFFQYLDDAMKTYVAELKLGEATDTLDKTGVVTETAVIPKFSIEDLQALANSFLGDSKQKPPMYSAVKIGGERLYNLARQGLEVERESRNIYITSFEILNFTESTIRFRVRASRGTYIRVLAADFAQKLGTVGHLIHLRRTEVCGLDESRAFPLSSNAGNWASYVIPISDLLKHRAIINFSEDEAIRLFQGKEVAIDPQCDLLDSVEVQGRVHGQFLGIVKLEDQMWHLERGMAKMPNVQ